NDFDSALAILKKCRETFGDLKEITQATADVENARQAAVGGMVEKAVRDARALLLARQHESALNVLNAVSNVAASAPPKVKSCYESLKKDGEPGVARLQKRIDLDSRLIGGSRDETIIGGSMDSEAADPAPAPKAAPPKASPPAPPAAKPSPQPTARTAAP